MTGAISRSLWPCCARGDPGVETRMNVRSVRKRPSVEIASTLVRPLRSPKCPHQPVVRAESNPMIVVIIVCRRAAPACTAGSAWHRAEGMRRGSSVSSLSRLSVSSSSEAGSVNVNVIGAEEALCWTSTSVSGAGENKEAGTKWGPSGSIEAKNEACNSVGVAWVWFHLWSPCRRLHESCVKTSTRGARVIPR